MRVKKSKEKPTVTITIEGPTQTGKTIVLDRIEKMLKKEFGAEVHCIELSTTDLYHERRMNDFDNLSEHEINLVSNTQFILVETNEL